MVLLVATACSSGSSSKGADPPTSSSVGTAPAKVCANGKPPPQQYESVVVFSFENRTWRDVGLGFGSKMPYLHQLGRQCAFFRTWNEIDPGQNSLTQYVGQITGAREPGTVNDCSPSATCSTRSDNLFRQVRVSGRRAVSFVEGATRPCSAEHNAPRHVPALYLWSRDDRAHCKQQVRPLGELDVKDLPSFAFITPNECNDGHDCDDRVVDGWARAHIQPVLESDAYRAGKVAVFVWYDEDRPVPNLWITPTAATGALDVPGAGAAATLKAWQSMLGLPCLAGSCAAVDLRSPANS